MGRTEFLTSNLIASEPWLDRHIFNESEMARSSECRDRSAQKVLDTADIVREAIYQQLSHSYYRTLKHSSESQEILGQLFQVLVHRLGHLKHVQFLAAEDRLQLVVGQDFPFVLWVLKIVLLDVRPNLFCDFTSRQRFCADNLGQVL